MGSQCDDGDGGENRSEEGNKVLKYVLMHGMQWVWAMVGSWEWLCWCWQWVQESWTLKMAKTKLISKEPVKPKMEFTNLAHNL